MSSQDEGYRGKHDPNRDHERHGTSREHRKSRDVEAKMKDKDHSEGKSACVIGHWL